MAKWSKRRAKCPHCERVMKVFHPSAMTPAETRRFPDLWIFPSHNTTGRKNDFPACEGWAKQVQEEDWVDG